MIRITGSDSLRRAIERAKAIHPKVTYIAERRYKVFSPRSSKTYFVRFEKQGPHKVGYCDCQAGINDMACYHIAAALQVNTLVAGMRKHESPRPSRYVPEPLVNGKYNGIDI